MPIKESVCQPCFCKSPDRETPLSILRRLSWTTKKIERESDAIIATPKSNNRTMFHPSLLAVILLLLTPTSLADTVELAQCPKEPNVVGVYINNGKNCVRERTEVSREIVNASCKSGWELVTQELKAYCRVVDNSKYNQQDSVPVCPIDYQRYGSQCHAPCPRGYNAKRGKCIQLKDTMPQHSMTCSSPDKHRIGAFCCETDQCGDLKQQEYKERIQKMQLKHRTSPSEPSMTKMAPPPTSSTMMECNLPDVPGRFYYNALTGNCDRSRISEPRVWTKLPRDKKGQYLGTCSPDETKVLGGCQPKCPKYYKSQKGMCHLPPCSIPFGTGILADEGPNDANRKKEIQNKGIVLCPEGKYYLSSQSY